jgi:hypothetical protein
VSAHGLDALVASPHWALASGMQVVDSDGDKAIVVSVSPAKGPKLFYGAAPNGRLVFLAIDESDLRPDLDHPGNHGHTLTLVRKAWRPTCRVEVTIEDDNSADVSVYLPDGKYSVALAHMSRKDTLGQSLAAALLAAPAKAGAS